MNWIGISGSRKAPSGGEVEQKVREVIRDIFDSGDGIVSGGALGVDYFATDEALKSDPSAKRVRIYLPVTLVRYAAHYRKRADEGVITPVEAELLIAQLEAVRDANADAIIEHLANTVVDREAYYDRNTRVVEASDELYAFRVTNSGGTGDTIEKAEARGIPVMVFDFRNE